MFKISRRSLLATVTATSVSRISWAQSAAGGDLFEQVVAQARDLASRPAVPPAAPPAALVAIDYDAYQKIQFDLDRLLWPESQFPVALFHPGRGFEAPVEVSIVEHSVPSPLAFDSSYFEYGDPAIAAGLPPSTGFAGFRLLYPAARNDWFAFLGASYFRSAGPLDQYGLSARGLAIDTGLPTPEEFPVFKRFWLVRPNPGETAFRCYALLDSVSVTGAYAFEISGPGEVSVGVDARLFFRREVSELGIAPLTSMYWYSQLDRSEGWDWRPEIHDTDGLALWRGNGERIWRPLRNPPGPTMSSFFDTDPRGFGLMQRDRSFEHYQDDGVFYDRRPSVWIEPDGGWGAGSVRLVELPTDDEIHDNVVAFWTPEEPHRAGAEASYRYRMFWTAQEPHFPDIGKVVATYRGRGGIPGQPRPDNLTKYVIDFEGGQLAEFGQTDGVEAVTTVSAGTLHNVYALPVVDTKRWRGVFDIEVPDGEVAEMRCFLARGGEALTETWLYQQPGPTRW